MYISGPNTAAALDLHTGRELWTWSRPIPKDYQNIGFGRVSRGPAILDGQIFVATLDCYLVALDARSGLERWSAKVEDYKPGYSMTLAPLAIPGKVLVGVSGGETGIRGFVDAYDAKTGNRAWRFYTIPGPGEPGQRNLARRKLEDRRRFHLGHRFLRSRNQPGLLGHRQPRARLESRFAPRR